MKPAERLLQRYHDGEASRAEKITVESMLAQDAELARRSRQLEWIDSGLRHQARNQTESGFDLLAGRVMERLPAESPRVQASFTLAHVLMASLAVGLILMAVLLADLCRPWLPTEAIAAACALAGLALVVAARPLAHIENSLLSGFLARRVTVGDGEVLVCRALGIALLIGAAHIVGLWS